MTKDSSPQLPFYAFLKKKKILKYAGIIFYVYYWYMYYLFSYFSLFNCVHLQAILQYVGYT